ncbi:MAG TPA: Ig-like domain-containing protein, partial [Polyangia bacterium]
MPRGPAGPGSSSLRSGRAAALVLAVTLGAGACSDPSFVPPDAPAALATTPPSPANDNQPRLTGTAASDLLILVYTDPFCAGPVVARGTGLQLQSPGIALDVADDTTTTFHVVGVRPDGFASPCSAGLTFVEDSTAPAPPTLTATDPASPGRALSVLVQGQAEAGTTVEIYTDSTCAGAVAATGTAADLATGLTVAVPPGATTTFAAVALDAAHNRSTCSKAALSYTQDGVAPDAPALDHTVPASPSNASTTPVVVGTAAPHAMIALYSTADCTGTALAENDADAAGDFALQVAVPANATTMLRATARDAAGNVSPCSPTALAYTHDDVAPATPVLGSTTPPSPTRASLTPTVHGTAEAGTQVGLYAEPGCAGPTLASVAAAADGAFAITVTVTGNTRTTFFAQARDAAGNLSDCTAAGLAYVHDSVAPVTPALTGTSPASPSPASTTPTVAGTAETGATVRVYAAADCTGAPLGEGAAADGTFAVAITVPANAATPLAVTATDAAGNVSACAGGLTYAHDSIAPAAPTVGGTAPASPTNVTRTPAVTGTAEAGATVTLYADGACGGAAAGTGAADTTGAFSVVLATPVATNVATQLSATATDTAGNVSPCATAIGYLFDDQAPAAPVLAAIAPASPAPEPRPTLSGSAEAGATVRVYATSTCGGTVYGTGVADGTGAFAITLTTAVPANQASTLRAAATDPAGNASPCSAGLAYAHDDIAPPAPSINSSTPPSPANTGSIVLHGTAQAGATVDIYVGAGCPGSRVATGTADGTGTFAITVSVANNAQTDFYARGVDAAGNVSTCSVAGFSFVEDSATPTVPAVTGTLPPSPSNDTNPTVIGTADPGVTVRLYADGACAGAVLGTGITNGSGGFSIAVVVPVDHTTTIYATATDVATNTSACGGGLGYTEDSTAPAPPSGITTTPAAATPSQNPRPTVAGAAEAGTTVRIYAGACTGTIYGTGIADGTGHFSIPLTVDLPEAADLIRATATDAATNVSLCATGPTYTFDQTRPAAPAITGTTPSTTAAGPANVATPTVTGTAEAGATVRIRTGSCTGAVVGAGPATGGNFSIVLTTALTAQGANTLYADATDAAGNTSATCATISYYFDSVLPAAPAITSTTPATTVTTPTNVTTPTVAGTAEADATVRLRTGSCTGAVVGAGPATGGNFSIVLTTAL